MSIAEAAILTEDELRSPNQPNQKAIECVENSFRALATVHFQLSQQYQAGTSFIIQP